MGEVAYLVVRKEEDGDQSRRSSKLAWRGDWKKLDTALRRRIDAGEVEYMAGVDAWTVRLPDHESAQDLQRRFAGLPLEVADETRFFAV